MKYSFSSTGESTFLLLQDSTTAAFLPKAFRKHADVAEVPAEVRDNE